MISSRKAEVSADYLERIHTLRRAKIEINDQKIKKFGYHDIDDHGCVYFPEFRYEQCAADENDKVYGMKPIAENFSAVLAQMPLYINGDSALACAWPGDLATLGVHFGMAPGDYPQELDPIYKKYDILHTGVGGKNHLCPDMKIGLTLGWGGLLEKIRHYRMENKPPDTTFYDGEESFVLAVMHWVERNAEHARILAADEPDMRRRQNFLDIAGINDWLISGAPRTMREACQFLAHFNCVDRMYFMGGGLGQVDELLCPFYENDMNAGRITDEDAIWYLASLMFNDTHYTTIAGRAPNGRELVSRVTFLMLDAIHHLNIPQNTAVRVYRGMHPDLLRRGIEYTFEDGTGVCYSLAKGCEEGFAKNGYPIEIACSRIKAGCNWTAIPGREYPLQDVTRINMAYAMMYAIQDMRDAGETYSIDIIWKRFTDHLEIMVDCIKQGYDRHYEVSARNAPEIVLNLFMHGPIERGLDVSRGGVDIANYNVDGLALATVADSFAAIEQRVIHEKNLTWDRLFEVLDTNYQNAERERLMLKNIDRFGVPDSLAESWALRVRDAFVDIVRRSPTPVHHIRLIPGLFSHGDINTYGRNLPATPNGRKRGEPISHSGEPDPDFARGLHTYSPTLKASAVAKVQPGYGNSAPLQLDIDSNMLGRKGGIDAVERLIHTHNEMGGTLINLNCLTREKLMEAHADPSRHPDLVVRVTGYSAFFASLSREYRQQIIDRFLSDGSMVRNHME